MDGMKEGDDCGRQYCVFHKRKTKHVWSIDKMVCNECLTNVRVKRKCISCKEMKLVGTEILGTMCVACTPTEKACKVCGIVYPNTIEFYYESKERRDGLQNTCIACRRRLSRENDKRRRVSVPQADTLQFRGFNMRLKMDDPFGFIRGSVCGNCKEVYICKGKIEKPDFVPSCFVSSPHYRKDLMLTAIPADAV